MGGDDLSPQPMPYEEDQQPMTDQLYQELQSRAVEMLRSLQQDEQMAPYMEEFQRVLGACQQLKKEHGVEKVRVEQLMGDINRMSEQIENTLKLSDEDKKLIVAQKSEIDLAWRQRDMAQAREQEAHKQMNVMRDKLEELQREGDKMALVRGDE